MTAETRPARTRAEAARAAESRAVELLTGGGADTALRAVVEALGLSPLPDGSSGLQTGSWRLTQLNHRPGAGVTGVYAVTVRARTSNYPRHSSSGADDVLVCLSTATMPRTDDHGILPETVPLDWSGQRFTGWAWPEDPWLPALGDAVRLHQEVLAGLAQKADHAVSVAYRPTRRAVLRLESAADRPVATVKVVRPKAAPELHHRHLMLARAHVPVPHPLTWTERGAVTVTHLCGPTAAERLTDQVRPQLEPENLLAVLDRFPSTVLGLPRRASWTDRVLDHAHAARVSLPTDGERISALAHGVHAAACAPDGQEDLVPTHGDYHPGNLILGPHPMDPALGPITGVLDLDCVGPGRLSDDLACYAAHTWVLDQAQRNGHQIPYSVQQLWSAWDSVVDPVQLRVRTAGVLVSLISVGVRRHGTQAGQRRLLLAENALQAALDLGT